MTDANKFPGGAKGALLLWLAVMQPPIPAHIPRLRGPTQLARLLLSDILRPGDYAVDATCGNGHDTLLLAELVGPSGKVWAFDIQKEAIGETGTKLARAGMVGRVELIQDGHESMAGHIPAPVRGIVFNLGYRPGGNRSIITRPETTLEALEQATRLLLPQGILTITVYPGHDGGNDEERAVSGWVNGLEQRRFHSWRMGQVTVPASAPYLFLIQKAI